MPRIKYAQIENKNALIELLEEGKPLEKIYLANNAYKDPKTKRVLELARKNNIPIEKIARRSISRRSKTSSHESVIGLMEIDNQYSLQELLSEAFTDGKQPFYLIFGDIKYPQNVGAIFRTAYAAGVTGIITPVQKANLLSDEIIRISMGTCLRIPIVEVGLFAAIKEIKKQGIPVLALDMDGKDLYDTDLTGPVAIILGSEYTGVSSKIRERIDGVISIPMNKGIGSLNVGVASAITMYEKYRQELAGK
ncbi:23S rRNA (guanosine(2251)-2'-O)-methyltransferase RlmB [Candidatus Nomurabacteria bacterium]|nr:23S rRNA (guanosine(2251)-2'-O)-methyltransferase RlmB [Candidatus Nomurabacteria bacterium]